VHFCVFFAPCALCAPDCSIFLKMHHSAHSADLCTLCTLCTQCTLRTSETLFLGSSSKCTRYIMCTFVHPVHPVHPLHLKCIYFQKCTRVYTLQICAPCAPCALCALMSIFNEQDIVQVFCFVHFCVPFNVCHLKPVHLCIHCIARSELRRIRVYPCDSANAFC
jgi:hypothetical protein